MSFTPTEVTFLQRLVADKPQSRAQGSSASFFSSHYSLGIVMGRRVEYLAIHIEAAQRLLELHDLPVAALSAQSSRADVAQFGGILTEKSFSLAPHANSVSVKARGSCSLDGHALYTPAGASLVMTAEQAMQVTCERILVVENFETFRWLETYAWINYRNRNVLVVYRGDKDTPLDAASSVIGGRTEPIWSFTDFDPAGVAMANALPRERLESIVLPDLAWLENAAKTSRGLDLFDKQERQYSATLDATTSPLVSPVWALLKRLRSGVTQERMSSARAQ